MSAIDTKWEFMVVGVDVDRTYIMGQKDPTFCSARIMLAPTNCLSQGAMVKDLSIDITIVVEKMEDLPQAGQKYDVTIKEWTDGT